MNEAVQNRLEGELRGAILAVYAFFVSAAYASPYIRILDYYHMIEKPFVFRQLSIWGVTLLQSMGPDSVTASYLFFGLGGILLFYSLLYAFTLWQIGHAEIWTVALLAAFVVLFYAYPKPYDMLTAAFFTLAIVTLARNQLSAYLVIFFLSSLNKETTILLLPVFMIHYWRRLHPRQYWLLALIQAVTFVTMQGTIRFIFRDAPGSSFWFSPVKNIADHWIYLSTSLLSLAAIVPLLWLVFRQWRYKPMLLRTAFVVLAPVLAILYFVAGRPFEFRVFAEMYSVTALLALPQRWL